MAVMTCEFQINRNYLDHYNLDDEDSLNAFHHWIGILLTNALESKYGRDGLSVIAQHELWGEDFGLLTDCDFRDLEDGAVLVSFSREPYPPYPNYSGIVTHIEDCGNLGLCMTFSYDPSAITTEFI